MRDQRSSRKAIALPALCVAVAVVALPVNGSYAEEKPSDSASASAGALSDPTDTMSRAVAEGKRVESITERTESSQLFANPDGTWTAEMSPGPVRAQDENTGEWAAIDTDLIEVEGGFAPKSALGGLVLADGGDRTFARMTVEDSEDRDREVRWDWEGPLPEPDISEDTATYRNVSDGADLVVTATATGFRHDLVLRKRPTQPVTLEIPVKATGSRVVAADGGTVDVLDTTGETLIKSSQAVMYDAQTAAGATPEEQVPVATEVEQVQPGQGVVQLSPSSSFLQDPDTEYPVTIDPTYTSYVANDTYLGSGDQYSRYPWNETLRVGSDNGGNNVYRTYLQFSNGPWLGSEVSSATLRMRNFRSLTCSGSAVNVARVTAAFDNGDMQWRTRAPATSEDQASSTQAYGASGCSTPTDMSWNITNIVRAWATNDLANRKPNYGLRVAAGNESINSAYREFRSDNYDTNQSAWPRLTVTFNRNPLTPESLTIDGEVDMDAVYADAFDISATLLDADSDLLTGSFSLADVANPTVNVWTQTVSQTAAGSAVTARVPAGTLVKGKTYRLKIQSRDGAGLVSPVLTDDFVYFNSSETTETRATVESTDPIVISGVLEKDGAPVANGAVLVQIRPKADYTAALPDEAQIPMWRLGNVATDSQGAFSLNFDPASIPEAFESDMGTFNVELGASDGTDTLAYDVSVDGVPDPPTTQAAMMQGSSATNNTMSATTTTDPNDGSIENVVMDLGTGAASTAEDPLSTWEECDEDPCTSAGYVVQPGEEPSIPTVDGRDEENVVPETSDTAADRAISVADANAAAEALLAEQNISPSAAPASSSGTSSARISNASMTTAAVPMAGGCARAATNQWKRSTYERFGSIYNWGGAKADWTQTTSSEHTLGMAASSGDKWRASGVATVGKSKSSATSNTARDVVNKNAYNYVAYRKISIRCGANSQAYRWEPQYVSAFFVAFTKSVKQTWSNASCVTWENQTFVKEKGRAYTKSTGVDLVGVLQLSAQSGNNRSTRVSYDITKPTRVCPSTNSGVNVAPAVRLFKP